MFSISINCRIKSSKHGEQSTKNIKIKPFINQYNWKEIDFTSKSKDLRTLEQNNKTIALNILFGQHNTKQVRHAYKSKHNFKHKN